MQLISRIWLNMLKVWWQLTVPVRLRAQGAEHGVGELIFLCSALLGRFENGVQNVDLSYSLELLF